MESTAVCVLMFWSPILAEAIEHFWFRSLWQNEVIGLIFCKYTHLMQTSCQNAPAVPCCCENRAAHCVLNVCYATVRPGRHTNLHYSAMQTRKITWLSKRHNSCLEGLWVSDAGPPPPCFPSAMIGSLLTELMDCRSGGESLIWMTRSVVASVQIQWVLCGEEASLLQGYPIIRSGDVLPHCQNTVTIRLSDQLL